MPSERVLKYLEIQDGYAYATETQRKHILAAMEALWENMDEEELAYIAEHPHLVPK